MINCEFIHDVGMINVFALLLKIYQIHIRYVKIVNIKGDAIALLIYCLV